MLKNNDNVVSKNLPIYFIWFGSDVPPKYFGNLQKAAETNKSRDIILVYSEKHLPEGNRKNIDSLGSISVDDIKTRVALARDSNTKNLWKIDVYDMELDKQDERIYPLLNYIFSSTFLNKEGKEIRSRKFSATGDIIKLSLLNITGGIYFDMDTEITGEIGDTNTKLGFAFANILVKYYDDGRKYFDPLNNFIVKSTELNDLFNKIIDNHFSFFITNKEAFITPGVSSLRVIDNVLPGEGKKDYLNFTFKSLSVIKFRIEHSDRKDIDYNNPENLKKLGLDKTDSKIATSLSNLSLESVESSEERSR